MALGVVLGAMLLLKPIYIGGGVRLSIDTLIYCVTMIEVGFQAMLFAVLSRAYTVQEGLIPKPNRINLVEHTFSLERGILLGVGLLLIGVLLMIYAITIWYAVKFGELDTERVARIVIVSSLSLSLGFEIILSSFLLSTLKLNVRSLPQGSIAAYPST
jgi:hypothetical protein